MRDVSLRRVISGRRVTRCDLSVLPIAYLGNMPKQAIAREPPEHDDGS